MRIAGPTVLRTGRFDHPGPDGAVPLAAGIDDDPSGIGRLADNDIVLDDPRVSGHHARLLIVAGFQTLIEDIGSSNGTFLNSADRRVTGPTPITESDTLYFGTLAVPAARLLRSPANAETRSAVAISRRRDRRNEPRRRPIRAQACSRVHENRWLLAWLAQAPVLAV